MSEEQVAVDVQGPAADAAGDKGAAETPKPVPGSTPHPATVRRLEAAVQRVVQGGAGVTSDGPMGFGRAVRATLDGQKVRRSSWTPTSVYLFCTDVWLMIHKADGVESQVLLQRADLEGEDWVVTA